MSSFSIKGIDLNGIAINGNVERIKLLRKEEGP